MIGFITSEIGQVLIGGLMGMAVMLSVYLLGARAGRRKSEMKARDADMRRADDVRDGVEDAVDRAQRDGRPDVEWLREAGFLKD